MIWPPGRRPSRPSGTREERWAESLAAHTAVGDERWEKTRRRIERVGERNSVAGYDLTFSAPKSVSVLWASAPDQAAQRAVRQAHHGASGRRWPCWNVTAPTCDGAATGSARRR